MITDIKFITDDHVKEWTEFCFRQHDIECNQKYNGLPYSFHLKCVITNVKRFRHLLAFKENVLAAKMIAAGHDLIEDARMTYNDVKQRAGQAVADGIYACTEEKGRTRGERHSEKFFVECARDPLASYVKLCDILANATFSLLQQEAMYEKYRAEWPHEREIFKSYHDHFKELFAELDWILKYTPAY